MYTRFVIAIPVLGLFASAVTLTVMAAVETAKIIGHAVVGELLKKDAVLEFIELADVFLLATVLYIMSLGLYELFIDDSAPLPDWLTIHSLDDLKVKLVGVIAVVLAVSFLGSVIKGIEPQALAYQGVGIAAVVAAMGYFLGSSKH
ncbi:MAG: YqhA family protein [Coriobacteriia bacterium]|nr:YqhA family protein [Coriobacteriia bacterium]